MKWLRLIRAFAPDRWWARPPFLPVPPWCYLELRLHTQYGQQWWRHWRRLPADLKRFVAWREGLRWS